MLFYYLLFLILTGFAFIKDRKFALVCFFLSAIMLACLAGFRGKGIDNDYQGYIQYYLSSLSGVWYNVEPSFILIAKFVDYIFNDNLYLFVIYAFLGVLLKFYAIKELTHLWLLSVLIYFSNYYLLFEMTQIRAGIAAGFLLLCIKPIKEKKILTFLTFAFLAFLFHYSAIIIFPLYFLNGSSLCRKLFLILIPSSYVIYFSNLNLSSIIEIIPIPLIQLKFETYYLYAQSDNSINLFNYVHLSRCMLGLVFIWKSKLLNRINEYSIILIKIYILALFVFVAFGRIPGVSARSSELLLIVEIVLIPLLLCIFKEKRIALLAVVGIGLIYLSFALFYTKLVTSYFN